MRVEGRSEYSVWGRMEWIPILSSFIGIGRLIARLFNAIFSKENAVQSAESLEGRVKFWSEERRGALAIIPILGNAILYWHDRQVEQDLNDLEQKVRKADSSSLEKAFSDLPNEVRFSESNVLDLVRTKIEVLEHTPLICRTTFMLKAARDNLKSLNYTRNHILKDPNFIVSVIKETRDDLAHFPDSIFANFKDHPQVIIELLKVAKFDVGTRFPAIIENFKDNQQVMIELAKRNISHLSKATTLMQDENFVFTAAQQLFRFFHANINSREDSDDNIVAPTLARRYCEHLHILQYAPQLCQKEEFLLNAKAFPYLRAAKYVPDKLKIIPVFILKMMKDYQIPELRVSATHYNYEGRRRDEYEVNNKLNQIEPLSIASDTLKNPAFIKQAIEIDEGSLFFTSGETRKEIFTDENYVKNHCNSVVLMSAAFWENRENRDRLNRLVDLLPSTVFMDRAFQGFVASKLPWLDRGIKELVAREEKAQNDRFDRDLQQRQLLIRLYQLEQARVDMQMRLLSH